MQIERQNKNLEKNNDSDTEEQDEKVNFRDFFLQTFQIYSFQSAKLKKEIKAMLDEQTETKRKIKDTEIRRQLFNKAINEVSHERAFLCIVLS